MKKNEIAKLVTQLQACKESYYKGEPTISDAEYDALEDRLRQVAPDHEFLTTVGYAMTKKKWFREVAIGESFELNGDRYTKVHAALAEDSAGKVWGIRDGMRVLPIETP